MTEKYQQSLVYLTINSSFCENLGLFHGKMGIALFFAYYAHVTHSKYYADFVVNLLEEIYEDIHWDLSISLENGLCGIGWGIEYLVQHGFVEGDTDEILADIDRKVMEIDPLRISDLSFRQGLAGIAFYVSARLNARRKTLTLPFDTDYLESLQKALILRQMNNKKNESPEDIYALLKYVLDGNKITLSIPNFLIQYSLIIEESFNEKLLGLENGLAGWLWGNLDKQNTPSLYLKDKKYLFLFDEESRSTKYGIGTYGDILVKALQYTNWEIVRIRTFVTAISSISIKKEENITYINIAKYANYNYRIKDVFKRYYQNVFIALSSYLKDIESPVFHLNTMHSEVLALQLKNYFPQSFLVLTVHYTNWSLKLLGDREKFKAILNDPNKEKNQAIISCFEREKRLMKLCDQIIAIAQHSCKDLVSLYQISKDKITLIPHGLNDDYKPLSEDDKKSLRNKYGFIGNEQLLIFAGRIDFVKGIQYIAEAFSLLVKQHPQMRLIIAGDGDYDSLSSLFNPNWSKVTYTGFIDKKTLYELYSISDIGILPSLHEEFGFVALEMMMMNLPLIVGKTTGLSELVYDGYSGILIPIKQENPENAISLKVAIETIINDRNKRNEFSNRGRSIFLQKYRVDIFKKNMIDFYDMIYNKAKKKK